MKIIPSLLLACAAAASAGAHACSQYWVAPDGNDGGPGTRTQPFRTLDRARDAVRADPSRGQCEIAVNVRGEHRIDHPLVLDARDSGADGRDVVWRAEAGARASILGSVRVTGWKVHDAAKNIWSASTGTTRDSRQLFVNGQRAVRARTPDYPNAFARSEKGFRFVGPGTMPSWSNASSIEAVTITQWKMMRCPVSAIVGIEIRMQDPCWTNANVFVAKPGEPVLWSFILLSRFENAYEFLDEPGEWYLDAKASTLYYIPKPGEDMASATVELPIAEALVDGRGEPEAPVRNLRFEDLTFAYATWLRPSGPEGYAADQSGFTLTGGGHKPNVFGHDPNVTRTPGNVRFSYAQSVRFLRNDFEHLGAVALDFQSGSQDNVILDNEFRDISSAAIQVGGVDADDAHPPTPARLSRDNRVANNLVSATGRDYFDAAGIYVGFTTRTTVEHNDIEDTPWAGIAIGWGWGLRDPGTADEPGSFPGVPGAVAGEWGHYDTPSASRGNRIVHNRIRRFRMELWDGGAIYTQGQQGASLADGEVIGWNVATDKRPAAGSNVFYTDGGSRFVTLISNVSYNNPVGNVDFGPCGLPTSLAYCGLNVLPYGSDIGGCIPHGDLHYLDNYFFDYIFFDPCPYKDYPRGVDFRGNTFTFSLDQVPAWILKSAGRQ